MRRVHACMLSVDKNSRWMEGEWLFISPEQNRTRYICTSKIAKKKRKRKRINERNSCSVEDCSHISTI